MEFLMQEGMDDVCQKVNATTTSDNSSNSSSKGAEKILDHLGLDQKNITATNVQKENGQLKCCVKELVEKVKKLESSLEDKEEEKKMWQKSALELQVQLNDLRDMSGILDDEGCDMKCTSGVL
mmetsp:Transcript_5002/g.5818  ORF Transcript_5002/g.5818 Transcript_5002/m.5818 type:complete len:123 (-) Transcript_5002:407-775(-)